MQLLKQHWSICFAMPHKAFVWQPGACNCHFRRSADVQAGPATPVTTVITVITSALSAPSAPCVKQTHVHSSGEAMLH